MRDFLLVAVGVFLGVTVCLGAYLSTEPNNQIRYGDFVVVKEGFHQGRRGQVSEINKYQGKKWVVNFPSGDDSYAEFSPDELLVLERKVEIEPWSKD